MSDVSGYLIVSAKSSCCDITCKSVPGSPPPFLFFVGARGEPGNEAKFDLLSMLFQYGNNPTNNKNCIK